MRKAEDTPPLWAGVETAYSDSGKGYGLGLADAEDLNVDEQLGRDVPLAITDFPLLQSVLEK